MLISTRFLQAIRRFLLLSGCMLPAFSQAQVYKWVDAQGKTHYSERKEGSEGNKLTELKLTPAASASQPARNWEEEEAQLRRRQLEKQYATPPASRAPDRPKSLSNGTEDGSDASRCRLARDILSGAVRHANGKPLDQYDREVAENDVRRFCH